MLDSTYRETVSGLIGRLPYRVQIPPAVEALLREENRGAAPQEQRRFARRISPEKAILQLRQTLPAIARPGAFQVVLTKDFSRGSIGFYAGEQLFPEERFELWTLASKKKCKVTRCQRLGPACYEIGAEYVTETAPPPP